MLKFLLVQALLLVIANNAIFAHFIDYDQLTELYPSENIRANNKFAGNNNNGSIWAVLVAGSNGWYNYRHQADILHAYHILLEHGVRKENIITMMYDDIAYDDENPYKGKIFNNPTERRDVYAGVEIDYTGKAVTPENFVAILLGNKKAVKGGNGRVLESTSQDKVFINFADHGGVGIICFPETVLSVKTLRKTLIAMHKKRRYKELTFYLEACESGSMFAKQLQDDLKIYAVTASNASESSWGCYCDTKFLPENCLGDCFSVNWMEDSDQEDLLVETLERQYEIVKTETNESHVCQFGDIALASEDLGEFLGSVKSVRTGAYDRGSSLKYERYSTREIPLAMMLKKYVREVDEHKKSRIWHELQAILKKRGYFDEFIKALIEKVVRDPIRRAKVLSHRPKAITRIDCHHKVVHAFNENCFAFSKNSYALKFSHVFVNLCELRIDAERINSVMVEHCSGIDERMAGIV